MRDGALRALALVEVRRGMPPVRRGAAGALVVCLILLAVGWATPGRLAFVLAMFGGSFLVAVPVNAVRDKLDGGLEFLVSLPVDASFLALARVIACAAPALPAAAFLAGAATLVSDAHFPGVGAGTLVVTVFPSAFLVLAAGSMLATGLALRLEVSQAGYVPLGLLLGAMALGEVAERVLPDPVVWLPWLLARPWLPVALWGAALGGSLLVAWAGYALSASAIRRFRPGRDRIPW